MKCQLSKKLGLLVAVALCGVTSAMAQVETETSSAPAATETGRRAGEIAPSAGRGRLAAPAGVVVAPRQSTGLGNSTVPHSVSRPGNGPAITINQGAAVGGADQVAPRAAAVRGGAEQVGRDVNRATGDVTGATSSFNSATTGQVGAHPVQTPAQRAAMTGDDALTARAHDTVCSTMGARVCAAVDAVPAGNRAEALAIGLSWQQATTKICGGTSVCATGLALTVPAAANDLGALKLDGKALTGGARSTCTGTFGVAAVTNYAKINGADEVTAMINARFSRQQRVSAQSAAYRRFVPQGGAAGEAKLRDPKACGTLADN